MEQTGLPNQFLFDDRPGPLADAELRVEGTLPESLRGRLLFNGTGQLKLGGEQLHLFDGYGRVVCTTFSGGGARLRGQALETPLYRDERTQDRVLKRRLFANKPSRWSNLFDLDLGNPCNHNVIAFGRRLMAGQDPGYFMLDPNTLDIARPFDCGGLFRKGMNVTPMPRVDPASGRLVLWLQKPGPKDHFVFAEVGPTLDVVHQVSCQLPPGLRHDVAFTQDYYLVLRFAELKVLKVLWGAAPVFDAVHFGEKTSVLHLVPRKGGTPLALQLPDRMHFHFFNAFQDENQVVVDTIGYRGGVTFNRFLPDQAREKLGIDGATTPAPEVIRYRIDVNTLAVEERVMPDIACEVPEINPAFRGRAHRYGYATAKTAGDDSYDAGGYPWFGGVAKLDFQDNRARVWSSPPGSCASPPCFVPDPDRKGEDAGFLLSWVQTPRERRASLVVLDAQHLDRGPIAQAHHDDLLGFISHVAWSPS